MKRVLFVNSTVYLPGEGGYKRTLYLFNMMREMNYNVTLLTSDFNHYNKTKRDIAAFRMQYPEFNDCIVLVDKMSYKKNISLKRLLSDLIYEKREAKWIKNNIDQFDCIFVSDLEAVTKIEKIRKHKNISLIIDVRDLFPEAMKVVIKNKILYNLLTFPFKLHANRCYSCADEIVAVSQEYLDRAISVNKKSKNPKVVYIGSIIDKFDAGIEKYKNTIKKSDNEFWITYVGTIGASYDFITIINSMRQINAKNQNVRFKIIGQGPEEACLKKYVSDNGIKNIDFVGFVPYEKMAAYLSKSDININNIKKNASQSIINKVADYFASGKPVLNSCVNAEMKWLIDNYHTGLNYEAENVDSFLEAFYKLYNDPKFRVECGNNSRKISLKLFDRKKSYKELINVINNTRKSNS